jgi:hypothetical protein
VLSFAFGRGGLTSLAHSAGRRVRHAGYSSRSFVSSAVYARYVQTRARPWDETTGGTITHGDGSPVVLARHPPRADLHHVTRLGQLAQMPVKGRPGHSGGADSVT